MTPAPHFGITFKFVKMKHISILVGLLLLLDLAIVQPSIILKKQPKLSKETRNLRKKTRSTDFKRDNLTRIESSVHQIAELGSVSFKKWLS